MGSVRADTGVLAFEPVRLIPPTRNLFITLGTRKEAAENGNVQAIVRHLEQRADIDAAAVTTPTINLVCILFLNNDNTSVSLVLHDIHASILHVSSLHKCPPALH